MGKKEFYKELFYIFGSHSNVGCERFNGVYELYGISFDLKNFSSDKQFDYIPFEGKLPTGIKKENITIDENIIKTKPIPFIRFLIFLHDFYTNLYHDGNYMSLKDKEDIIVLHALKNYLKSNSINITDMKELASIINEYYDQKKQKNRDLLDEKINDVISEIDDHSDLEYMEFIDYKEMCNDTVNTLIRDYRIGSRFSLMSKYFFDARKFQDLLDKMNKTFFKGINLNGDKVIEIKRLVKEKANGEYKLRDFNRGCNTITIIYDQCLDGYKKLTYNLNTNELSVHLVCPKNDFKITRIISEDNKLLLLDFLERTKNKINKDMRDDNTKKR